MEAPKIIVLYANKYNVQDEKTGRLNEGVSISYILGDCIAPVYDNEMGSYGLRVAKATLNVNDFHKIKEAPAIYNVSFVNKVNSKGQIINTIADIEFAKTLVEVKPKSN